MNYKYFLNKKYSIHSFHNRWISTTNPRTKLSQDVWNFYNPDDPILEGEIIHHVNGDPSDDRIENLQKMTQGEHLNIYKPKRNSVPKTPESLEQRRIYVRNYQRENTLDKSLSYKKDKENNYEYMDILRINKKIDTIIITHTWRKYN